MQLSTHRKPSGWSSSLDIYLHGIVLCFSEILQGCEHSALFSGQCLWVFSTWVCKNVQATVWGAVQRTQQYNFRTELFKSYSIPPN